MRSEVNMFAMLIKLFRTWRSWAITAEPPPAQTPSYYDDNPIRILRQKRAEAAERRRHAFEARYGQTVRASGETPEFDLDKTRYGFQRFAVIKVRKSRQGRSAISKTVRRIGRFDLALRHRVLMRSRAERLIEAQRGLCYLCGEEFTNSRPATQDHVMPRARGGKNHRNILMAHGPCNVGKADRLPTEAEMAYLRAVNTALANDEPPPGPPGSTEGRKRAEFAVAMEPARVRRIGYNCKEPASG